MLEIIVMLIGSVLAAFGWALQRRIRGDAVDEAIRRRLNLVRLYRLMKSAGLDPKSLERLETELIRPESSPDTIKIPEKRVVPPPDPNVRLP
jgi:hypothetical protein